MITRCPSCCGRSVSDLLTSAKQEKDSTVITSKRIHVVREQQLNDWIDFLLGNNITEENPDKEHALDEDHDDDDTGRLQLLLPITQIAL